MLKKIGQITAVYLFSTFVLLNAMCVLVATVVPCSPSGSYWLPDTFEKPYGCPDSAFISKRVGNTCESWLVECCYGSGCEVDYPLCYVCGSFSLPGYIDLDVSINWEDQGPVVIVTACEYVFPAKGVIAKSDRSVCLEESFQHTHICGQSNEPIESTIGITSKASVEYFFWAEFDRDVFIVNENRSGKICLGSGSVINITLVKVDCETLKKALDATVKIYKQRYRSVISNGACGYIEDDVPILPFKAEFGLPQMMAEVSVKVIGMDLNEMCSLPNSSGSATEPSGCSGGGCGGGAGKGEVSIGHASATISSSQDITLGTYGSLGFWGDNMPMINAGGAWFRALHYPWGLQGGINRTYQGDPLGTITKISGNFSVLAWNREIYYYEFEESGSWTHDPNFPTITAERLAWESMRGKVRLKEIKSNTYPPKLIRDFSYYPNGQLQRQRSFDANGNPDGYIYYEYEELPEETPPEVYPPLARIWAGVDPSLRAMSLEDNPSGGRWIDVKYTPTSQQAQGKLRSVDFACSECRPKQIYHMGGPKGDQVTAIKQVVLNEQSQPVERYLKRYTYDSRGRMKSYSLGDFELLVNQWERTDFDPADPDGTTGGNILIRRDFVTNTEYRAKVYLADDNGGLTSEIHYHDVQTYDPYAMDQWLVGPYSVYSYSREGSVYVTTYPKGNKLRTYYDAKGNVIKRQWEGALHPHVQYEYQDYWQNGNTVSKLKKEINAYGGQTVYDYTWDGLNLIRRTDPLPQFGVSDNESQVTEYEYEQGRLVLERTKDSLGQWISTKYEYDDYGNMVKRIEGYGSSNPLETIYQYNEFNENVKVIEPGNKIRRNFYSASGTLTATAVYSDDQNNLAVSATVYVYENGMLKATKEAKMDEPFVFVGTEDGITWVSETYDYDDYGRRIAVIKDADGEHLVTRYEYNNQNEIVLVLKPDQRYQRTVRDGRGLVSREITGVKVGEEYQDKAITSYYYDLNGNLTRKVDPEGVTEIYQYDYRDRMIRSRRSR